MSLGRPATPMVRRGDVFDARLDPVEGSEQGGTRPVIVISRNAINSASRAVVAVPCTTFRGRRRYPSQVVINAPLGGLTVDSVALGEQVRVLSKTRLLRRRGSLPGATIAQIERALMIALGLPRPGPGD